MHTINLRSLQPSNHDDHIRKSYTPRTRGRSDVFRRETAGSEANVSLILGLLSSSCMDVADISQPPTPTGCYNATNNIFFCVIPPTWPARRYLQTIKSSVSW